MTAPGSVSAADLTEADFAGRPVWRFRRAEDAAAQTDESHVEPDPGALRLGGNDSFLVAARYAMDDGSRRPGAVQVDIIGRRVMFTPALLFVAGRSLDPLAADVGVRIARITRGTASRPTAWMLDASFVGEPLPRRGRIAGSVLMRAAGLAARLLWLHWVVRRRR